MDCKGHILFIDTICMFSELSCILGSFLFCTASDILLLSVKFHLFLHLLFIMISVS